MILVVDDDPAVTASLTLLLKRHGHPSRSASSPREALALLEEEAFDLVLQDMNFSRRTTGEEGLALLGEIRSRRPGLPVVLITAWGSISLAVEGMKAGAADFVTKPWSNARLLETVETALALRGSRRESEGPGTRAEMDERLDFAGLVGEAPAFLRVLEMVGRVAPTDASVLLTGESGTGKEMVAEAVHRNSRRRDRPFVKVNLGGISSTLFESEMFGHVRGAFTDAARDRRGRFEVAHGGTIFLDEIGDLDPASQVKLLRVLQDHTFEVLGSSEPRSVDVRVVSATNRDLGEAVREGAFREDLLYRLNLITIHMPALRERRGDILPLARHFLERAAARHDRAPLSLAPDAERWLEARPWPGNVRQLQQNIERAVLVLEGDRIDGGHLETLAGLEASGRAGSPLPAPGDMTLEQMEREMIRRCLERFEGNLTRAAEALGISRQALYRRLEKHGLTEA